MLKNFLPLLFIVSFSDLLAQNAPAQLQSPYSNPEYVDSRHKLYSAYVSSLTSADRRFLDKNRTEYKIKFAELKNLPEVERVEQINALKLQQFQEIVQGLSPRASVAYISLQSAS